MGDLSRFWDSEWAGDVHNSIRIPNYCDEPYSDLGTYANKVISPWTKVWFVSYRSRAPIVGPGGRVLDFVS